MRLYSITNMYTPGIHAGIQTAHALHSMFRTSTFTTEQLETLHDWADNHKTIIVLNGGYHENIERLMEELWVLGRKLELPTGEFYESKAALNGAATAVCIVVPSCIYDRKDEDEALDMLTEEELELYRIIKSYPLAK